MTGGPAPTRILLRSPRDLLSRSRPITIYRDNMINNNSGNLIFTHAVQRTLSVSNAHVHSDLARIDPQQADRINNEYDLYVLPFANAFRPSFHQALERYCELIERLTIPVVIVGIGAQFPLPELDADTSRLTRLLPTVHRFMRAVLARSASVGVRGEVTYRFLRSIGYSESDVTVIGCPSLFQFGPTLHVSKEADLTPDSPLCINISPYLWEMGPIALNHAQRYPNIRYIAQDRATLRTLLYWQNPDTAEIMSPQIPYRITDPLIRDGRTWFFVDPTTWIDHLRQRSFSFGSRIHGNITSLLAGTPAVLLGHDSRTVELAEYHGIPYRLLTELAPDTDASELFGWADYTEFNTGQQERFDRYLRFLEANNLDHVFTGTVSATAGVEEFDRKVAAARNPGPVTRPTKGQLRRRHAAAQVRSIPRRLRLK
ncbi:MAG: polysaccharide pyruvyl transferase family protein [Actinomycetes bacterium]